MASLGAWIWVHPNSMMLLVSRGFQVYIVNVTLMSDDSDKATSELLPAGGEDIALNLEICDQICSKSVPAKDAMRAFT
ncbi:hypothetical protein BYT27DRAFT_7181568 [Phlegmacium glaucopus]|nr:hypothetical protein BYT27DRAFT_7181568 [Phlegmacium glaucopus]